MEAVEELESADQKMNIRGWSRLSGLIPQQQQAVVAAQPQVVTPPTELLQLELRTQQLKDESLWNYSYKKAVGLMVRKNPPPRWTSLCSLTAMTRRPAEQRRAAPSGVLQAGGTWPRG